MLALLFANTVAIKNAEGTTHGVLSRDGCSPLELVSNGYREVRAVAGVIVDARVAETQAIAEGFEVVTDDGAPATARRHRGP